MNKLILSQINSYVEANIEIFHQKRIERLAMLKLRNILKKKNPYLFRVKNLNTSEQIIRSISDAFISSSEETIFGDWLKGLAIFVNQIVYNGIKSGIKSIDLEFNYKEHRYIVSIKSGPNWGNSSQIEKMRMDFNTAKKTLRTSNANMSVIAINGCCYGIENKPDKGDYFKYCGQSFWAFISGERNLYKDIIEPLGYKAKEKNDNFNNEYSKMINRFTKEFIDFFCKLDGSIDWAKLMEYNSAISSSSK